MSCDQIIIAGPGSKSGIYWIRDRDGDVNSSYVHVNFSYCFFTGKKIKFPAVLLLQDRAQFHILFPTHVLEILGNSRTSVENCT